MAKAVTAAKKPAAKKVAPVKKPVDLTPDASRKGLRKPEDQAQKDRAAVTAKKTPRPKKVVTKSLELISAWSYSRFSVWRQCPYLAYLKFIEKRKEGDNPYQARGNALHKLAEDYVKGVISKLPKNPTKFEEEFFNKILPKFKAEFAELKKAKAQTEQQLAFTIDWKPTGWFDKNVWVRIKTDATLARKVGKKIRAIVVDHKSGKVYMPDHEEQLELYAIAAMIEDPTLDEVDCEDWYFDTGKKLQRTYTRKADLERLKTKWENTVRPMLADGRYEKKPSDKCKWCHFRAANGGPCNY